jgi:hypothetical protein
MLWVDIVIVLVRVKYALVFDLSGIDVTIRFINFFKRENI